MSKPSTSSIERCSPAQLKALLTLVSGEDGEHVRPWATRLPERSEMARLLSELCSDRAESGDLLLATVTDATTPLVALRGLEDLSKTLLADAETEGQRVAATLLYHASIAAAYARHGVNLSSRPITSRVPLYEDLGTALGGEELGRVFRSAAERGVRRDERT